LLDAGHQAVVYDNLSQGHREAVLPGAEFIQGEILDGQAVESVIKKHKIEGRHSHGGQRAGWRIVRKPSEILFQ